ncbi:MAG: AbrB/MazE/SpoVT family DNA-binding domain-containing protein [Croceibacterium sp.]
MGKEYKAKVFKSGNSLALRLPKGLGLREGSTMILREERTGFVVEPEDAPKQKLDVSGFWGKAPWLRPLPPELREFEERPSAVAAREARAKAEPKA